MVCIFIIIQGCELFETRPVQPPSQSRYTFTQPTTPDIVVTNLTFAIAEKSLDNYLRCLVDTNFSPRRFKYYPDALSQSSYPVFIGWNSNSEKSYFSNLLSFTDPDASSTLFSDNVTFSTFIDSTIIDFDYTLIFNHSRQTVAMQTKGKLRFIMGTDSRGLWSIHSWYDFINSSNDTTWSVLKANFIN